MIQIMLLTNQVIISAWFRMPEAVDDKWSGMFCMPRIVEAKNGHIYFRLHPNLKKAYQKKIESPKEAGYCIHLDLEEGKSILVGGYRISRKQGKIYTDRRKVFVKSEE
ncbi:MAG: hypothetical protein HDT41_06000 [Lachnospiraceae bacterium]|nr:hypothetical protein [Lachnospiraceae bacterium]